MNKTPGYRFTETQAKEIVQKLQQSVNLMDSAVAFANQSCDEDVALPFKEKIAEIMFDLGWEVLEQGFYKKYPNLRPPESSLK